MPNEEEVLQPWPTTMSDTERNAVRDRALAGQSTPSEVLLLLAHVLTLEAELLAIRAGATATLERHPG